MKKAIVAKKPALVTRASQESGFFSLPARPFHTVVMPPTSDAPDLESLKRKAERFGHRLESGPNTLPLPSSSPPVQRQLIVKEERPSDFSEEERQAIDFLEKQEETFVFETWKDAIAAVPTIAADQLILAAPSTEEKATSPIASWKRYMAALLADLRAPRNSTEDTDLRDRVVTAVLMNRVHNASFLAVDPLVPKGETLRQESPLERRYPMRYFRSSDKGHPLIELYKKKSLPILPKTKEINLKTLLAPYNQKAYSLFQELGSAPENLNVNVSNLTTRKGSHREPVAGHIGLRQSNVSMIMGLVQAAAKEDKLAELVGGILEEEVGNGCSVQAAATKASAEHLEVVRDALVAAMELVVGQSPLGSEVAGSMASPAQDEVTSFWDESAQPENDPYASDSYVIRKLGQTNERTDCMLRELNCMLSKPKEMEPEIPRLLPDAQQKDSQAPSAVHLKKLQVARQMQNSQLTVQVPEVKGHLKQKAFISALQTYFQARTTYHAVAMGLPLAPVYRQSFGFLDTAVSETKDSFRISWGTEPPDFRHAVRNAIFDTDKELHDFMENASLDDVGKGLLSFLNSPDAPTIAYYRALQEAGKGSLNLKAFLEYTQKQESLGDQDSKKGSKGKGLAKDLDQFPSGKRIPFINELAQKADESLQKIFATQEESSTYPSQSGSMEEDLPVVSLPILEPLYNLLRMAFKILTAAKDPNAFNSDRWSHTRITVLGEILSSAKHVKATLAELAAPERSQAANEASHATRRAHAHRKLRNAAEDLNEAIIVFLATTNLFLKDHPEAKAAEFLKGLLNPIDPRNEAHKEFYRKIANGVNNFEVAEEVRQYVTTHMKNNPSDEDVCKFIEDHLGIRKVKVIRADSGEQAGAMSLIAAAKEAGSNFLLDVPDNPYFELESFISENKIRIFQGGTECPTAGLVDPRPYLTKVVEPQNRAGDASTHHQSGMGAKTHPYTLIIDATNMDYTDSRLIHLLLANSPRINNKSLRIIIFTSGAKHEQLGLDKFQYGRIILIGEELEGLKEDFNDNPLLTQYLNAQELVRDMDHSITEDEGDMPAYETMEIEPKAGSLSDSTSWTSEPRPTLSSASTNSAGIPNIGNSCYLAAVLNLLTAVKPYREVFKPRKPGDKDKPDANAEIRKQIDEILAAVETGKQVPEELILSLRTSLHRANYLKFGLKAQHDAYEILTHLFTLFDEDLADLKLPLCETYEYDKASLESLKDPAGLDISLDPQQYTKLDESYKVTKTAPTTILPLPITDITGNNFTTLEQYLKKNFECVEDVEGKVIDYQGNSKQGQARRSQTLKGDLPRAFTISLQRFASHTGKNKKPIKLPPYIDLFGEKYILKVVVHHKGDDRNSGHYVTTTRESSGSWMLRDDDKVSINIGPQDEEGSDYLCTFERADKTPEIMEEERALCGQKLAGVNEQASEKPREMNEEMPGKESKEKNTEVKYKRELPLIVKMSHKPEGSEEDNLNTVVKKRKLGPQDSDVISQGTTKNEGKSNSRSSKKAERKKTSRNF